LIIGGAGSLGSGLVRRILTGEMGYPESVAVFSRDEAKHHDMRMNYPNEKRLRFVIGYVQSYDDVVAAVKDADIVFNCAAMKQVGACEDNPDKAVETNCQGAINIVSAIRLNGLEVDTVVGISSDKGCEPINVYGATKFLQEKILLHANNLCDHTRFIAVCYGNVMASRGSVVPVFQQQVRQGGPVTITHPKMTRFLLTIDQAVDCIFTALRHANRGDVFVPRDLPAAYVGDIASVMIGFRKIDTRIDGIRPGEKMHEILISEVESSRTIAMDGYFVVTPKRQEAPALCSDYISSEHLISREALAALFEKEGLLP